MAKRLSAYKKALKALQSPLGGTSNEPPAGSVLSNVKDYLSGVTQVNYTRDPSSRPGELTEISINPFATVLDPDGEKYTTISKRALDLAGISTIRTACNIITTPANTAQRPPRGFKPAKAIVFIADGAQSATLETSQITGYKYNPKDGASYTIPMGQATAKIYESVVQGNVITAVKAIANASVSFQPEVWKN